MDNSIKEKFNNNGIDVQEALGRFMNNEAFYEKCLLKFLDDKNYSLLEQSMREKDYEEAFTHAHTVKGLAGNLSLISLADVTGDLVEPLRNGNYGNVVPLFEKVKSEYEKVCIIIREAL